MAKKQEISYTSPNEGFWTIPDINYRGESRTYRLFEQMTPAMTQDNLSEFYEQEKAKGNPYPTDEPLIWAVVTKAHEIRNENLETSEKLKQFLRKGFRTYLNTLTRIIYNPSGKDKIIHNYRTSDEYSLDGKVIGPNVWIGGIPNKIVLEKLLGTSNIEQINKVSQWINKTNMRIWTLNSEPKTKDERVAGFGAYDWLDLNCYRDPLREEPAFRVLKVD